MKIEKRIIKSIIFNKDGGIFCVETPSTTFQSNDLSAVLRIWHYHNCFKKWPENLKALSVGRIG